MWHHLVVLYQNTSNYSPGVEISPMLWGLGFHMEVKKEILKNLVPNRTGESFDIWYVASSSGPLSSLLYDAPGVKTGPAPGGGGWFLKLEHKKKERRF